MSPALVLRDRDADGNAATGATGLEERVYPVQDANLNVVALVTASGAVSERYAYDPFGSRTVLSPTYAVQSAGGSAFTVGFQGMSYDASSGTYHADAREYSPTLGRWVTTDPLLYQAGDGNFYRFVGNNPGNMTDPSGLADPTALRRLTREERYRQMMESPGGMTGQFMVDDMAAVRREQPYRFVAKGFVESAVNPLLDPYGTVTNGYRGVYDMSQLSNRQLKDRILTTVGDSVTAAANGDAEFYGGAAGTALTLLGPTAYSKLSLGGRATLPERLLRDAPSAGGAADPVFDALGRMDRLGRRPIVDQLPYRNTCGPTCVDMVLETVKPGRVKTLAWNMALTESGTTIDYLAGTLTANGVQAEWKLGQTIDQLAKATVNGSPVIAHVRNAKGGHFVVVDGVTTKYGQKVVAVRDPSGGIEYFETVDAFSKRFTGQLVQLK